MSIEYKEVTPELRINHLDVIGDHEKIIAKEKNYLGIVVFIFTLAGIAIFYFQKRHYKKKIDEANKKNKQTPEK